MKDIQGYEGLYAATENGQVWSYRSKKFLKPKVRKDGYLEVCLVDAQSSRNTCKVHRLVASAFIPNPDNLEQVNHKDENKANNSINNLEWCSCKYNNNYGSHNTNMGKSKSKAVYCIELDQTFYGAREAERQTGISRVGIGNCCRGTQKVAGGYHWRFADE